MNEADALRAANIATNNEVDKNSTPDVPSLRSLQIANGNLQIYVFIFLSYSFMFCFSFAFHTVVEFVSFKLGHFLLKDDLKKGIIHAI